MYSIKNAGGSWCNFLRWFSCFKIPGKVHFRVKIRYDLSCNLFHSRTRCELCFSNSNHKKSLHEWLFTSNITRTKIYTVTIKLCYTLLKWVQCVKARKTNVTFIWKCYILFPFWKQTSLLLRTFKQKETKFSKQVTK